MTPDYKYITIGVTEKVSGRTLFKCDSTQDKPSDDTPVLEEGLESIASEESFLENSNSVDESDKHRYIRIYLGHK